MNRRRNTPTQTRRIPAHVPRTDDAVTWRAKYAASLLMSAWERKTGKFLPPLDLAESLIQLTIADNISPATVDALVSGYLDSQEGTAPNG